MKRDHDMDLDKNTAQEETSEHFVLDSAPEPSFLRLHRSGELARRARQAVEGLAECRACPRSCGAERLRSSSSAHGPKGATCSTGRYARVSSSGPHYGEERCLTGRGGSGTIFFSYCSLRCVFCQNREISHEGAGVEVGPEGLAAMMLDLARLGCHNINLVTPAHVTPQILEALVIAAERGLNLPIVYNTSGYESLKTLALLDGVVDVYMPDFKFLDEEKARSYLEAADYPKVVRLAMKEMHRQVGPLTFSSEGLALRGLLVRHLVMPGAVDDTKEILRFLAEEISPDTYVNVMGQYYPSGAVDPSLHPELCRRPDASEMEAAFSNARRAGLRRLDAPRFALW